MIGWWTELEGGSTIPVAANDTNVRVTAYVRPGRATLVAAANFGPGDVVVSFSANYTALGLAPTVPWHVPAIPPFQLAASFAEGAAVRLVAASGGLLFVLGDEP